MSKNELNLASNELRDYLDIHKSELNQISKSIINITNPMDKSSSGSWAGFHANLYFKDFKSPGIGEMFDSEWGGLHPIHEGWNSRSLDDIWDYIHKASKPDFDLDAIDDKLHDLMQLNKDLKLQLELHVGDNEILKDKISQVNVDFTIGSFIKTRGPRSIQSRDSKALYQGMQVPPHIQALGFAKALEVNLKSASDLLKLSSTLESSLHRASHVSSSMWNYVNPFWLLYQLIKMIISLFKKHKIIVTIATILVGLVGLVAADYNVAFSNIQNVISFFTSFLN